MNRLNRKPFPTNLLSGFILVAALSISACSSENPEPLNSQLDTGTDESTSLNPSGLKEAVDALPPENLSATEADGLIYMREEEKLAHDTYIAMFDIWGSKIFDNISSSEQTHTDAVLLLLDRYAIADPVGTNATGVFVDITLQDLYDTLTAQGTASLVDALLVGAAIEEIDIIDIQEQLDSYVDNQDITLVYNNLLNGSRNHLRAFVRNLEAQGMVYTPQYLSQDVYDAIINTDVENG